MSLEEHNQGVREYVLVYEAGRAYRDAQDSPSQTRSSEVASRRYFESR
jgi:hypothetical protein